MLGLAIVGVVLSLVLSQDMIGVYYSFDVDFERTFDSKSCISNESWKLVDYTTLGVAPSPSKSRKGIKSTNASCTSSFPIVFINNSVLELDVFVQVIEVNSGLEAKVYDEKGNAKLSYVHNKRNNLFKYGWNVLSIPINTNVTGYINLVGHSQDNEIVLVDSFRYVTSSANNRQNNDKTSSIYQVFESHNALTENLHEPTDLLFDSEGSGDEIDGSGEEWDDPMGEDEFDDSDPDVKGVTKIEE